MCRWAAWRRGACPLPASQCLPALRAAPLPRDAGLAGLAAVQRQGRKYAELWWGGHGYNANFHWRLPVAPGLI